MNRKFSNNQTIHNPSVDEDQDDVNNSTQVAFRTNVIPQTRIIHMKQSKVKSYFSKQECIAGDGAGGGADGADGDVMQCRICLQSSAQSLNKQFISPCQCNGSVMYVHQECFTEWMATILRSKKGSIASVEKQGLACEMCKMKFSVKIYSQNKCSDWGSLKSKIKQRRCQFIIFMASLLFTLVMFSIVISFIPKNIFIFQNTETGSSRQSKRQTQTEERLQKVLILTALGVLILLLSLILYWLISEFLFTVKVEFSYKGKQAKSMKGILNQKKNSIPDDS